MIDLNLPPRKQTQLIGFQDHFERLKDLESRNALHPAWLIAGQRGIGKATFAYRFVRYLLSESSDNSTFYNMLIDQGSHPNLLVLEKSVDEDGKPESDIKINQVRKLIDFARQSPAIPGWRIVIIDAIDEMNRNAANSLLKILEEPPQKFLFLMVCHSMGSLLPTIRSRCNILHIKPLSLSDFSRAGLGICPDVLSAAQGSLGTAVGMRSFDLREFCRIVTGILYDLRNNSTHRLFSYVSSLDKKDKNINLVPSILQWIVRETALFSNVLSGNILVDELRQLYSPSHWVKVDQSLSQYLYLANGSHPDPIHLIQGALLLMSAPEIVHPAELSQS